MREPEKRLEWRWFSELAVLVLVSGIFLLALAGPAIGYNASLGVIAIIALTGMVYVKRRYAAWGFELRDDHLYIQYGVFRKVKTMAPFVRIQHVDTQRGVLDRLFGLSRVVVYTAGSRGADMTIPGLFPGEAEKIQKKLRDVAIESEDRDAV